MEQKFVENIEKQKREVSRHWMCFLLESVSLILPFLSFPEKLIGNHIVIEIDNISVIHSWSKKYMKNDPETSLILRSVHVLESFCHCKIYLQHTKRCSTELAKLADALSRTAISTVQVMQKVQKASFDHPQNAFTDWLKNPYMNWDLPIIVKIYVH
jgi:hypothetical protein